MANRYSATLMNVFDLRERLVSEYGDYVRSFISIRDEHVRRRVEEPLDEGVIWPEPPVGLSPSFEADRSIDALVAENALHPESARVFGIKGEGPPPIWGRRLLHPPLRLTSDDTKKLKSAPKSAKTP
jgi:hypothetical protein